MPRYAAFLRAVNVGGTGKLPMAQLAALATTCGFTDVRTYIQSGNLALTSRLGAPAVKATLEAALAPVLGKPCAVMVRRADELATILDRNPFPAAVPAQLLVVLLDAPSAGPARTGPDGEQVVVSGRELFIHYPHGMGRSKLKVPEAAIGTGRNLATMRQMLALTARD